MEFWIVSQKMYLLAQDSFVLNTKTLYSLMQRWLRFHAYSSTRAFQIWLLVLSRARRFVQIPCDFEITEHWLQYLHAFLQRFKTLFQHAQSLVTASLVVVYNDLACALIKVNTLILTHLLTLLEIEECFFNFILSKRHDSLFVQFNNLCDSFHLFEVLLGWINCWWACNQGGGRLEGRGCSHLMRLKHQVLLHHHLFMLVWQQVCVGLSEGRFCTLVRSLWLYAYKFYTSARCPNLLESVSY